MLNLCAGAPFDAFQPELVWCLGGAVDGASSVAGEGRGVTSKGRGGADDGARDLVPSTDELLPHLSGKYFDFKFNLLCGMFKD